METQKTVSILDGLIVVLEDGREGYLNASQNTEDENLKSLFLNFFFFCSLLVVELQDEINKLGKSTDSESGPLGALHRAWIDFKSLVTGHDTTAIIEACITGEDYAIERYQEALKNDDLLTSLRPIIVSQLASIEVCKAKIKAMESIQ